MTRLNTPPSLTLPLPGLSVVLLVGGFVDWLSGIVGGFVDWLSGIPFVGGFVDWLSGIPFVGGFVDWLSGMLLVGGVVGWLSVGRTRVLSQVPGVATPHLDQKLLVK